MKAVLSCILSLLILTASAQSGKSGKTATQTAPVAVSIVDSKERPRAGELIVFDAAKSKKKISGRSNAQGKLNIALPQGDDYTVTIKGMADSNQYTVLSIPLLEEGQSFTGAFGVDIVYEPAVSFTLDHVHFDVNKATLRPESYKELLELVEYMRWKPQQAIEIAGHTDNTGKDADNLILSQKRAETVKNFLVSKGISKDKIVAKGYGASQPVANNDTPEGKQKNRRTEVRLID